MRTWLTALRIARREARRAKGRSALVIAMLALPVLALSAAAASYDMFRLTPEEEVTRLLGAADARINWANTEPIRQDPTGDITSSNGSSHAATTSAKDLLAALPDGSRVTPIRSGSIQLRTRSGVGDLAAYGIDVADPMAAGLVTLRDGRAPTTDGEMALTEQAADRLAARIGGTVQNADRTASWTVTGIVEFPAHLGERVVFWPEAKPGGESTYDSNQWLWDAPAPVDWAGVKRLNQRGMVVVSRAVLLDPPVLDPADPYYQESNDDVDLRTVAAGGLIVGLGVLEVMLLAGPAFAVGARRRQRDLGLVAANGGTPAHLRRIVLADGVVLGVLGTIPGLLLGVVAAFAFRPLVEVHLAQQRAGGYRVFPLALVAIAGLAVGTGVLAALVPAFTAARGDVLAALTGRRGIRQSRKRWLVLGLALVGTGAVAAGYGAWQVTSNVLLAGLVLAEVGLVLCTPALVGLVARLGRVLPLAPRIALRDTARNRAAAVPAVAAVMAAVAGSVAIGVVLTAQKAREDAQHGASLPIGHAFVYNRTPDGEQKPSVPMEKVSAVVRSTLPATDVIAVGEVACPDRDRKPTSIKAGQAVLPSCYLRPQLPQDRQCPYDPYRGLSRAEKRAANADPRCEIDNTHWSRTAGGEMVAGPAAVTALTKASGEDLSRARETLAAGGVLVGDPRLVVDGKVILQAYNEATQGPITPEKLAQAPTVTVPGYAPTTGTRLPATIYSPGAVNAAKLGERPLGLVVATDRMPTQAEQDRLSAALRDLSGEYRLGAAIERQPEIPYDPTLLILAAVAGLITLGAAGIATGLAAADGRGDLATLSAVGASPGVRRWLSLSQSGVIAGLGTALGVIAGLGASTAVLFAYNQALMYEWPHGPEYPVEAPWDILAVVLVVPLVAMLGAGLLTRSRLPIERRRLT
ncbi:putative ABC transport system permease protein [Micromonospora viridifaciens]|uniref:Putative ABC transport system permease protein n=1 Tax=Micromonospora viridifaciens TaxID=1881 RepID=A0A1C4U4G9_MICVI|nr:FtsX-like permease family protein [Micromonospora viridifaciens]SCE66571.1 putative ABC transport system permease protein [Micromonospora viridifaciens]